MSHLPEKTLSQCKFAAFVASVFVGLIGLLAVFIVIRVVADDGSFSWLTIQVSGIKTELVTVPAKIMGIVFTFIVLGVWLRFFIVTARLFSGLRTGPILTKKLANNVGQLGRSLLWLSGVVIATPIVTTILDLANGGQGILKIDLFPDPEIALVFLLAYTLTTLARVLHDAVEIELENRQFI